MPISTTADSRQHCPLRGIALSVFGIGFITVNDSIMKLVVNEYPIGQAIFIRGVFVLILISLMMYRQGGACVLRIHSLRLQFWCAVLLVLPLFLFIYAQVRTTVETSHAGVGLELAIAIKLLEIHGAKLVIASELGRGTTVTIPFLVGCIM